MEIHYNCTVAAGLEVMAKILSVRTSTTSVGMKLWSLFLFQSTFCCFGREMRCRHIVIPLFLVVLCASAVGNDDGAAEDVVRTSHRNALARHMQVSLFFELELLFM